MTSRRRPRRPRVYYARSPRRDPCHFLRRVPGIYQTNHLSNLAPLVARPIASRPSRITTSRTLPASRDRSSRASVVTVARSRSRAASPRVRSPPERSRHGPRAGFRRADAHRERVDAHPRILPRGDVSCDCILRALEPSSIDDRIVTSKRPRAPQDFRRRRREVRAMLGAEIVLASMEREVRRQTTRA